VKRALEHNLGLILAQERLGEATGARLQALSELLPNANGRLSASRQKINLEAFGFPLPAGFPAVVGPFNVYDARVFVSQSVFDLRALNDAAPKRTTSRQRASTSRTPATSSCSCRRMPTRRPSPPSARLDAARAQVDTAQALPSGGRPEAERTRGRHRGVCGPTCSSIPRGSAAPRRKPTSSTPNCSSRASSVCRRDRRSRSPIRFAESPFPDITLEQAVERAYQSRGDYLAALERVRAAEASPRDRR
jgi:hypothetical protein